MAGRGSRGQEFGMSLVDLAGCSNINVFLNQDLSQQKYTMNNKDVPTGYASIVNYTTENGGNLLWEKYIR
jgi:hypothetical protein